MRLEKYIEIKGIITVLTGLHIGANKDDIEIGGNDNPIMRHPVTKDPYIPGSSLKGKLRSLLELHQPLGLDKIIEIKPNKLHTHKNNQTELDCPICHIFGSTADDATAQQIGPTRLIVRDCFVKKFPDGAPLSLSEIKQENTIDRCSGKALNPRPIERVVPEVEFEMSIILRKFEGDDDKFKEPFKKYVTTALELLKLDALGGSVSRGCGKVDVHLDDEVADVPTEVMSK